jgi:hypothetical protein
MPRVCTVCPHPKRARIDEALVSGAAIRGLSALYSVSEFALARHRDTHIAAALAKASAADAAAHGDDLLARLDALAADARRIQQTAEQRGDLRTALAGVRELVRIVELLAELRGELDRRPVVLTSTPEWLALRAMLVRALDAHPPARLAVIAALAEAGDGDDDGDDDA